MKKKESHAVILGPHAEALLKPGEPRYCVFTMTDERMKALYAAMERCREQGVHSTKVEGFSPDVWGSPGLADPGTMHVTDLGQALFIARSPVTGKRFASACFRLGELRHIMWSIEADEYAFDTASLCDYVQDGGHDKYAAARRQGA